VQNVNANVAPVGGNASQQFLVATTNNPAGAVPLAQAQQQFAPAGNYAALNGSSSQQFAVANATASSQATSLGQVQMLLASEAGSFNVKAYGATGNGTTDDTAAIQAADAAARAASGAVFFPSGNYLASQLVMSTNSIWYGEGIDATVLTQSVGANKSFITTSGVIQRPQLRNLSVNGNWNGGSGNTSGDGIDMSAGVAAPILVNVYIGNVAGNALHTSWSDTQIPNGNQGYPAFRWAMEGYFGNIKVFNCGQHGWLNYGPHDSTVIGFLVCNSGQAADNTYDAFHFGNSSGASAGGNFFYLHGYQLSNSTNRNRAALFVEQNVSGCTFVGCQFEGAYTPLTLLGNGNFFDSSNRYYASYGGVTIYLGGTNCSANSIRGNLGAPMAGRPAAVGISVGGTSTDVISGNTVDVIMASQEAGNIDFNSVATYNNNVWHINAFYNTTNAAFNGTPAVTDEFIIRGNNSNGLWNKSNRNQFIGPITIAAGANYTWTFQFPFASAPYFNYALTTGAGSPFSVTSLTTTSVSVQNTSSISITGYMEARAIV